MWEERKEERKEGPQDDFSVFEISLYRFSDPVTVQKKPKTKTLFVLDQESCIWVISPGVENDS